jgi:hypothetical protein
MSEQKYRKIPLAHGGVHIRSENLIVGSWYFYEILIGTYNLSKTAKSLEKAAQCELILSQGHSSL